MRPSSPLMVAATSRKGDSDAAAIIAAMTAPSAGYQSAIRAAVASFKTAGIWTTAAGLAMFAAKTTTNALIDWKTLGSWTMSGTNPTFTENVGFTGVSASSTYLDSPYTATTAAIAAKYTQNSNGVAIYVKTYASGLYGAAAPGGAADRRYSNWGVAGPRIATTTNHTFTANAAAGMKGFVRTASDAVQHWTDSTSLGTDTDASTAPDGFGWRLLQAFGTYGNDQISFFYVGAPFGVTENAAMKTICDTFATAVAGE